MDLRILSLFFNSTSGELCFLSGGWKERNEEEREREKDERERERVILSFS